MWAWRDVTMVHPCAHTHAHTHTQLRDIRKHTLIHMYCIVTHTCSFIFSLVCTNTPMHFITMQEGIAHTQACAHTPTHKSEPSGADQLFSCGGRSQLRHLKRTERSAWRRLPLLWFFTLRRSISLMQSCRALASIKSNIYQEIKRGEREEREGEREGEDREGCYDIFKE